MQTTTDLFTSLKIRIMAEPTLIQVFGANAVQDATTLTITKADLASAGLTASANNTAESLIIAMLLKSKTYLSEENRDLNIDQSVTIADGLTPSTASRNNQIYLRNSLSIEIDKLLDGATNIDPDDY
jgi:hypothetical protein